MSDISNVVRDHLPTLAGVASAVVVKRVISERYMATHGTEPPVDPGAPGSNWSQAILWTAILAAGGAIGRLLGRYLMAEQIGKRVQRPTLEKA
ncbi:DUF4235 domain-containing protein [Euzebya tangerina]|uniref:DUF4235 domain-containing protein n=1 Tax=Euzebya tangerina TaxID=591198 RepID=UPI000E321886|nr:DUF4235 domain-containing protein [Euzebya tangerina]